MKIAIFTDTFVPQLNGIVTARLSLAKNLADRGHKIVFVAPKYRKCKEFVYKNIEVIRVISFPLPIYPEFKFAGPSNLEVINALRKEKVDAILFETPISLGFQAILAAKILRVPLIGTFHTLFSHEHYLKHIKMNNDLFQRFSWRYARLFYDRCDIVTSPSEELRKELLKHKFTRPIITISNGVDLKKFDNSKSNIVKKKYNSSGHLLIYVGRVAHEKNLLYLLDCFKLVKKEINNVKLIIVGDGPQMSELRTSVKDMNLQDSVILTGKIDHEKLVKSSLFGACKIFVTTSKTETQGISTLEAQANGLVCVAINEGGVKDLIKNDYNGYLIKDGEKDDYAKTVIRLLKDKKLYEKLRINTLKEVKNHDLNIIVDRWEDLIKRCIKKKQKR
jgi:glycosyltransferase involved in cell wall biosynthesis